jgi:hypothetical protein
MNNYIIGGGVAGLVASFILKEDGFRIIDANPLGQMAGKFPLGPRIIQNDGETFGLLKDLGFQGNEISVKNNRIGFSRSRPGAVIIEQNPDQDFRAEYSYITRGTRDFEPSFMSDGKNTIEALEIIGSKDSYKEILELLFKQCGKTIIPNQVKTINIDEKIVILDDGTELPYDNLISTIDLRLLMRMIVGQNTLPGSLMLETRKKSFYLCKYSNLIDRDFHNAGYDYVYSVSRTYTRKTYLDSGIVYETIEPIRGHMIEDNLIVERKEDIPIQIKKSLNLTSFAADAYLLGRYAQWSHKIKLNEVLATVLKWRQDGQFK